MLKYFKPDMPAMLATMMVLLFSFSCGWSMWQTGTLDADFKQNLFSYTMLAVGFYLGSSSDSRKKTDIITSPAPVATTTTVTDASTVTKTEPAPGAPAPAV